MDLDEAITVAKLNLQNTICYLLIGWQENSFEMYLYQKDQLWKGRFSSIRLSGFSKNLHMSDDEYLKSARSCLAHERKDYTYDLKTGFFYWKRIVKDGSLVIEGFLPVELDTSPKKLQPDLIEILISLNSQLKDKVNNVRSKFRTVMTDYQKCLNDTEEFMNLKIEMEKTLSNKFLALLNAQKNKASTMDRKQTKFSIVKEILESNET